MAYVKYGGDQIWHVSSREEIKYGMCQVGRRSNMACVKYGGDQI